MAAHYDLPPVLVERLLWRHGSESAAVLALADDQPELLEILPGAGYIAAEAVYAVRHEGALHLEDVLARRLRISIETIDRGTEIAARVAALIAPELGWSASDLASEVNRWHDRVDAELGANATPDDETAQSVRRVAVDGRGLVEA